MLKGLNLREPLIFSAFQPGEPGGYQYSFKRIRQQGCSFRQAVCGPISYNFQYQNPAIAGLRLLRCL